ncbi:MFS general substrate transporter [Armillaria luteobubalina]|uniref:MFS general substrate transporter n=1 Tax=Armillaria luteobubalina TaxID=153913 RepID=A0AA39TJP6_9AGAR|nr:MFS general substrate transporter [Armillaria luteobubalina]
MATPTTLSREGTIAEHPLTDQTNLLPFRKIVAVFFGLGLCVFVTALDSVSVATSLATINTAFHAGSVISWVPSAYMLVSTAFQPLYGRFSDIFGRKATLTMAMLVFMVGNLVAGFSKNIIQLIVFRGFAGAGGGGIVSMMQIVVSDIVTLRERGKYQGIIQGVVAIGYTVGPLIGGALSQSVGWRWCFWITIPVSFIATGIVVFVLPLKPVQPGLRRKLLSIDYLGTILTLASCTLMMLPLIWGGVTFPWSSPVILAPLLSGFILAFIFCIWEWKGARLPIVPMYIFKHATVCGVYITMFMNGFVFFSSLYYLPQFFQVVLMYTPIHSGMFLIPLLVGQLAASFVSGIMISRRGKYKSMIHTGFAVWAIGCGCISTISHKSNQGAMVVFMLLSGIGAGQTLQPTTIAAQASVSRKDMSVVTVFRNASAASLQAFVRNLGGTLALAIGSTIINNALRKAMNDIFVSQSLISTIIDDPSYLAKPTSETGLSAATVSYILNQGYTKGFKDVFYLNASLTAFATLISMVLIKDKDLSRDDARLKVFHVENIVKAQCVIVFVTCKGGNTKMKPKIHGLALVNYDHIIVRKDR